MKNDSRTITQEVAVTAETSRSNARSESHEMVQSQLADDPIEDWDV